MDIQEAERLRRNAEKAVRDVVEGGTIAASMKRTEDRRQFAMAALTGILSNPGRTACAAQAAIDAWQYADAMLKARDKAKEDA